MRSGFVALLGRPNAGKSTLLNRMVGAHLAIVSNKPQTTRTRILGARNVPEGQLLFLDTPGVHRPLHRMNVRMVDAAIAAAREADVVALVVDASESTGRGTEYLIGLLSQLHAPVVLVLNKIDRMKKHVLLPVVEWFSRQHAFADIVPVSAATGDNVDRLEQVLLSHLPEGPPLYPDDYLTDQPARVLAAEMVREQVLALTRAELPFSTAVTVDRYEEPQDEDAPLVIYCSILVEEPSQKPIILGHGGAMIKAIGTAARTRIEAFFERRVYLDLHVKVRGDWRENDRMLDDLGLPKRKGS
ncbi:MAG: GTPase Era [Acidobacteria bacterium]|nr:GTPase Era [Acidobacteriota bacterium]